MFRSIPAQVLLAVAAVFLWPTRARRSTHPAATKAAPTVLPAHDPVADRDPVPVSRRQLREAARV